jgi:hypothetical protein
MNLKWTILALLLLTLPALRAQTGVYTVNGGTASQTDQTYNATETDQSSVYVLNSGVLTLSNCTMTKTGDASDVNESSEYGLNAGVLAASGGMVTISAGSVTTEASGANGLFATGTNSAISMSGGSISAVGTSAHGVDATYGGAITLSDVDVYTNGDNSSAVATDFGGGTVTVTGGTIISAATGSESHSAGIYSTGTITVSGAIVSSAADCGGVIDGANHIILNNTTLTGHKHGFKLWKTAPATGPATITVSGGSVTSETGAIFYVTGETGNAASATLAMNDGATCTATAGNLIEVTEGSSATLTISNADPAGNLVADDSSSLNVILQNGATLSGTSTQANVTLDVASVWTLTGESHVLVISNSAGIAGSAVTNIVGNGYALYYDPDASGNSYLNGGTYSLVNGGHLLPEGAIANDTETAVSPVTIGLCAYPNPFNPSTTIAFNLSQSGYACLVIYDLRGREVVSLLNGSLSAGLHTVTWNGRDNQGHSVASGVYLARLVAGGASTTNRLMLLK